MDVRLNEEQLMTLASELPNSYGSYLRSLVGSSGILE